MNYLIVVGAPVFRVSQHCFAVESAFGEHLRVLARKLRGDFQQFVVAAPSYTAEEYEQKKAHLMHIDEDVERIACVPLPMAPGGKLSFWLRDAATVLPTLAQLTREADLVHAGMSMNVWKPFGFIATLLAVARRRKTIFVVDIDFRESATMNLRTKRWSTSSWLVCKAAYDPLRKLQIATAARLCDVVLLKGSELARDFGEGNPRVHDFLDAAHGADHVALSSVLQRRAAEVADPRKPLELVYFGRLTDYKGVEHMLRAVARAQKLSTHPIRFHVIGDGEDKLFLTQQASSLGIASGVVFHGAVPFGPALFEKLYGCHLALAMPLSQDTPRSALDALASGLPILAYDTYYYRELAEKSGAVIVSPWNDIDAFARELAQINEHRERLTEMAPRAIAFARDNTQEQWLDRRVAWTLDSVSNRLRG